MGFVIAVANMKGGVGKTTTTVGLVETFAASGLETLAIDLDAQANATFALLGQDHTERAYTAGRTLEQYLDRNLLKPLNPRLAEPLERFLVSDVSMVTHLGRPLPVSVAASRPELRLLERELIAKMIERRYSLTAIEGQVTRLFSEDLAGLRERFGAIVIDCPPGISAFTEAAVRLADLVVAPTIPDFLSTLGLPPFARIARRHRSLDKGRHARLQRPWVLASKVRVQTREHTWYMERLQAEHAKPDGDLCIFETYIPERTAIGAATRPPETDTTYQQKWSGGLEVFDALATEIRSAIDAHKL